jgi:hypothetical protein
MPDQSNEQKAPSKEELIKFFQEQIDVKKVQFDLQELNTKLAVARAEELKALQFIAQMTNPSQQQTQPHTVTQEDIDANPELMEAGLKVGDEILIPVGVEMQQEEEAPVKSKKLKKEQA